MSGLNTPGEESPAPAATTSSLPPLPTRNGAANGEKYVSAAGSSSASSPRSAGEENSAAELAPMAGTKEAFAPPPVDDDSSSSDAEELPPDFGNGRFFLHPSKLPRQVYDIYIAAILIYNLFVIPFRVCFQVDATGFLLWMETAMDIMFGIDILINFRTGVQVGKDVYYKQSFVAKRYLKGWFTIDFVSAFPLDVVVLAIAGVKSDARNLTRLPKMLRLIRLIRLVKLIRVFKISALYRRMQAHIAFNSSIVRLINLALMMVVLSHFLCCFWYLAGVLGPEDESWLTVKKIRDANSYEKYVWSFYWAVTTVTTVGYGDVVASSAAERSFGIGAMILGVSVFSYAVGLMSYLVTRMENNVTQDRMDEVNAYMRYRKFPNKLQVAIREHYLYSWERQKTVNDETRVIKELSHALRRKVVLFLQSAILKDNPLFKGMSTDFMTAILLKLQPQAAASGDVIIEEGDIGKEMFILNEGRVEVGNREGTIVYKYLEAGSYFGEVALLTDDAKRTATCRACVYCQLDVLMKRDFEEVLMEFPNDRENMNRMNEMASQRVAAIEKKKKRRMSHSERDRKTSSSAGMGANLLRGNTVSEEDASNPEERRVSIGKQRSMDGGARGLGAASAGASAATGVSTAPRIFVSQPNDNTRFMVPLPWASMVSSFNRTGASVTTGPRPQKRSLTPSHSDLLGRNLFSMLVDTIAARLDIPSSSILRLRLQQAAFDVFLEGEGDVELLQPGDCVVVYTRKDGGTPSPPDDGQALVQAPPPTFRESMPRQGASLDDKDDGWKELRMEDATDVDAANDHPSDWRWTESAGDTHLG